MYNFLIVDDDAAGRRLLKHFLAPYGHCDLAFDGQQAVEAFELALETGPRYDLACLDIMMPGTSGHEVLQAIRQLESRRGIFGSEGTKIVMVTALNDPRHCIQAFNEGCESYVTKPIRQERLLAVAESLLGKLPASDTEPAPHPEPVRPQRRFLIVDDDRLCRELLRDILTPHGQCDFAYDGREGIDAVRLAIDERRPYDVICLDVMMPDTSGHEMLEAVRKLEVSRGIFGSDGVKVIMTTALRNAQHCVQAFQEGCEAYLTKPIVPSDLLSQLRQLGVLDTTPAVS